MPATKSPSTPKRKPYTRDDPGSNDDTKPDISPSKSTPSNQGQSWSAEELIKVFEVATKVGASAKNFERLLEGRTGVQCNANWRLVFSPNGLLEGVCGVLKGFRMRIAPAIKKMLEERGRSGSAKTKVDI